MILILRIKTPHLKYEEKYSQSQFVKSINMLQFINIYAVKYIQYIMLSTLLESQIYLGFTTESPLDNKTFEQTFVGGSPIFLREPSPALLQCSSCHKQKMTFICQIFCPFPADRTYNRVLYILYCEKCYRVFRCIKQQSSKTQEIKPLQFPLRVIMQKSYEIESEGFDVKQLQKIIKKAQKQVEEEDIEEAEDEDDSGQEDQVDMKEFSNEAIELMESKMAIEDSPLSEQLGKEKLEHLKQLTEGLIEDKKVEKDLQFEQYKKVSNQLNGPVLLYTNIPIPYNSQPLNPKHFCKYCKSKLTVQLQLTEKILLLSPKLVGMDWGSLIVYTCSQSCKQSEEECVVVQYQQDAIKDSEITALRKKQKNRKNKEQKDRSKSKKKEANLQPIKPYIKEEEQGDWD